MFSWRFVAHQHSYFRCRPGQVVDTGLDELSCFFVDHTGAVEHSTMDEPLADLGRRKVREGIPGTFVYRGFIRPAGPPTFRV